MWRQVIDPNWQIPYIGGWCEGYTEGTVGQATLPQKDRNGNWFTSGVWGNAVSAVNPGETGAWDMNYGNGNHPGELPPSGVTVAVFFALGSTPAGHTALSLDDGQIASSTQAGYHTRGFIHPNLQDLINTYARYNNGCTYLGWSEFIGKQRVVERVGNQDNNQGGDVETIKSMYWRLLGREADQGGIDTYTKAAAKNGWDFVYNDLKNSEEGQRDWAWRNPDAVRALESRVVGEANSASIANKARDDAMAELQKARDELSVVSNNRDSLEATVHSQAETIERLQQELNERPTTPGGDYSWVDKLQTWLRGIFK